jgi:probable F420-dependent oxidoreductase
MRIGMNLPQIGPFASADAIRTTAQAAEAAGYASLWVLDRLLKPDRPRSLYPGMPDGEVPEAMVRVLDPIGSLTYAAAVTERVRLGTSVLVAPWYPPVLLARALTTLDVLSGGRAVVGLGTGWSLDEYEAVDVPFGERGVRLDEAIDVLTAIWTHDRVTHDGRTGRIAPSRIEPKPVQAGGPPILLGAFSAAALTRAALRAQGWNPAGLPPDVVAAGWAFVRDTAARAGRDPDTLELVVRANIVLTSKPLDGERPACIGSAEQVAHDLDRYRAVGAHELILGVGLDADDVETVIDQLDEIVSAADLPIGPLGAIAR